MKHTLRVLLFLALLLALARPALAQESEYRLNFRRNFGYGAGINVRGSMSLSLVGNLDAVRSVTYTIDGKEMAVVSAAPFSFTFQTSDYPIGLHEFSAVVETLDGRQVTTPPLQRNFLSSEEESQSMQKIFIPILVGILAFTLIGVGTQVWSARRSGPPAPGTPRNYGLMGGTICPRCGRAYPVHIWSLSLVAGRLDRCDFCGKWAFVTRRSPADLAAAEQAERAALEASETSLPAAQENGDTEEERLRKMLDESRFDR
jgi:hypothetical protein